MRTYTLCSWWRGMKGLPWLACWDGEIPLLLEFVPSLWRSTETDDLAPLVWLTIQLCRQRKVKIQAWSKHFIKTRPHRFTTSLLELTRQICSACFKMKLMEGVGRGPVAFNGLWSRTCMFKGTSLRFISDIRSCLTTAVGRQNVLFLAAPRHVPYAPTSFAAQTPLVQTVPWMQYLSFCLLILAPRAWVSQSKKW